MLQQLHQHQPLASDLTLDGNDDGDYDEIDFQVPYRRPELVKHTTQFDDDEPLSDYVTVRLALARAKAMAKYREMQG